MPVIIAIVVGIVALVAYIYGCLFVLAYFIVPLVLLALTAGAIVGLCTPPVATAVVLAGYGAPHIRTPAEVVGGALARRKRPHQLRPDYAWPQYFAVQVRLDLIAAGRLVERALLASVTGPVAVVRRIDYRVTLFFWPILLPLAAAVLAYDAAVVMSAVAVAAVSLTVTGSLWAAGLMVSGTLRTLDRGWQIVLRAGGTCPRCYEVSRLPAYQCPGTHPAADRQAGLDLHRDLRPGRLGVLWRRCACGKRLPTTVLRAALRLQARCPLCGEPLHRGAAVYTDVRIPVFGAASAGKTHLIMGMLVSLMRAPTVPQAQLQLADDRSAQAFQGHTEVFDRGGSAPKTDAAILPTALTFRVVNRRRRAMIHIFDAAGEALADPTLNAQLAYLDRARTLIFVLDPFSVTDLHDRYERARPDVFRRANPARDDPESSYNATVSRLRGYSVETSRQRLAFVITKKDLLGELPAPLPDNDTNALRNWLKEHDLDNLVTAAERDFGDVRYFLVSVQGGASQGVTAPIRWLVAGDKLVLPPVEGE